METILFLAHTDSDGGLPKPAMEALGAAQDLSRALSGAVLVAGIVGAQVEAAASRIAGCGAQRFLGVSGKAFSQSRYASDAAAAEALCRASQATIVVAPATSRWSRSLAGVAQRLNGRIDTHAAAIEIANSHPAVTRWYYRQRMEATLQRQERPWIILADPGCHEPWSGEAGSAAIESIPVTLPEQRTTVTGFHSPSAGQQTIRPDANLLFVAGAGWTKKQPDGRVHIADAEKLILNFLRLAKASLGSSKSLVDLSGEGQTVLPFLTHLNQVGQTGSTPRHPKGLSTCCHGEEPHVVGWRFINERRAINLDPNCGWARGKADVLYVADAFAVVAKINALLAQKGLTGIMTARNIFALLAETAARHGQAPALYQPYTRGNVRKHRIWSWNEFNQAAIEIAAGLRQSGIQKGDVVALASETRAEFYLADFGIMAGGSIAAALYITYPAPELVQTLRACGAKAVFAEDPETLARLKGGADSPLLVLWVLLTGEAEGATGLEELRGRGRRAMAQDPECFNRMRDAVAPSDHAILYLTSGATGFPKMVLVSHGALLENVEMGPAVLEAGPEDRTIAFLPSAHIAQRVVMELIPIRCGVQVWFLENLNKLPQELKSVKPTLLLAPPRVWERIYHSVSAEIQKRSHTARKVFYGALGLGLRAAELRHQGKPVPRWMRASLKVADRLVFGKIRARLGGRLRLGLSGAAPLGKKLAQFYEAIGLRLIEGYGLTEGGVVSVNPPRNPKAGTIGKPLPGVEVRLADDGELLVRGATLFSGYYNDPQATADVMRDGWLATGDIAAIDLEGYITITGRKKDLIISSNGKKIYPSRIESLFKLEPIVSQILLVGDRLPYLTALFTVNAAATGNLTENEVFAEVQKAVRRVNQQLAPFEQIRKFRVLDREFSLEYGEITPTMKVRRAKVLENFREAVSGLYVGKEDAP